MATEAQLQRKELERLLLTAKDKERQEMLRKAIASLDETSAAAAQVVHPSFRSTLMEESMSNVAVEVSPSVVVKGMRPLSAQPRRRQSFGQLAPVPENRSLLARNIERHQQQRLSRRSQADIHVPGGNGGGGGGGSDDDSGSGRYAFHGTLGGNSSSNGPSKRASSSLMSAGLRRSYSIDGHEVTLSANDVRYAVASSSDPRCPPMSVFPGYVALPLQASQKTLRSSFDVRDSHIDEHSETIRVPKSGVNGWLSTGLMPQFFFVKFHERWLVHGVTIRCQGVEALRAVVSYDEMTEYYETEEQEEPDPEASSEWDTPHRDAMAAAAWTGVPLPVTTSSLSPSTSRHGRPAGHSFASSTSLVLPVTRRGARDFVCDVESACRDQAKAAPTMVVKRAPAPGLDEAAAAVDTGFGIVCTKLQITFLQASDTFIRVSEIEIKATTY